MKATVIFDMVSTEFVLDVPDGLDDEGVRDAVCEWLDAHLETVMDNIRESEVQPSSIEIAS